MGTTKAKQQVLYLFFYFSERKRVFAGSNSLVLFCSVLFSSSGFTVSTESNSEQWRGVDVERECERGSELIVVIRRLI